MKGQDYSNEFMNRAKLNPGQVKALVHVVLTVETGTWGLDCTVAQAVGQAADSARGKVSNLIKEDPTIQLRRVDVVDVVCSAEKK